MKMSFIDGGYNRQMVEGTLFHLMMVNEGEISIQDGDGIIFIEQINYENRI